MINPAAGWPQPAPFSERDQLEIGLFGAVGPRARFVRRVEGAVRATAQSPSAPEGGVGGRGGVGATVATGFAGVVVAVAGAVIDALYDELSAQGEVDD